MKRFILLFILLMPVISAGYVTTDNYIRNGYGSSGNYVTTDNYEKSGYGSQGYVTTDNYNRDGYGSTRSSYNTAKYIKEGYGTKRSYSSGYYVKGDYGSSYSNKAGIASSNYVKQGYGTSSPSSGLAGATYYKPRYIRCDYCYRYEGYDHYWEDDNDHYHGNYHDGYYIYDSDGNRYHPDRTIIEKHYTPIDRVNTGRLNSYWKVDMQVQRSQKYRLDEDRYKYR